MRDLIITEFVDHNDRPTADPDAIDRVLVTSLFGRTLPLIRYELTDVPLPGDRPCSCGAAFPLITAVKGRSDDIFVYPGDVHIHPLVFRTPLGQNSAIEQYQVRQTEHGAMIGVIAKRGPSTWRRSRISSPKASPRRGSPMPKSKSTSSTHLSGTRRPESSAASFRWQRASSSVARHFAAQGMTGTTLIAFDGEPSMIFELTAR